MLQPDDASGAWTPRFRSRSEAVPWFNACTDEQLSEVARAPPSTSPSGPARSSFERAGSAGSSSSSWRDRDRRPRRPGRERPRPRGSLRRAGRDRGGTAQRHRHGDDRPRGADHRPTRVRRDDRDPGLSQRAPSGWSSGSAERTTSSPPTPNKRSDGSHKGAPPRRE